MMSGAGADTGGSYREDVLPVVLDLAHQKEALLHSGLPQPIVRLNFVDLAVKVRRRRIVDCVKAGSANRRTPKKRESAMLNEVFSNVCMGRNRNWPEAALVRRS